MTSTLLSAGGPPAPATVAEGHFAVAPAPRSVLCLDALVRQQCLELKDGFKAQNEYNVSRYGPLVCSVWPANKRLP